MMVMSALYLHNSSSDALSCSEPTPLAEKQQITILVYGLTLFEPEPTIYYTHGKHSNNYTTDAVIY